MVDIYAFFSSRPNSGQVTGFAFTTTETRATVLHSGWARQPSSAPSHIVAIVVRVVYCVCDQRLFGKSKRLSRGFAVMLQLTVRLRHFQQPKTGASKHSHK